MIDEAFPHALRIKKTQPRFSCPVRDKGERLRIRLSAIGAFEIAERVKRRQPLSPFKFQFSNTRRARGGGEGDGYSPISGVDTIPGGGGGEGGVAPRGATGLAGRAF